MTSIAVATSTLGEHAAAYGRAGWEIFPLAGKVPLTAHGVLEATSNEELITSWWSRWPTANIGGRVPAGCVVVDVDPRHGGDASWCRLVDEHGVVQTRTALSGRGDGGCHLYLRHPGGKLRATIGPGLDVKTHVGYCVLPPSIHPDSGNPYRWVDPTALIASAPAWLIALLRKPPPKPHTTSCGANRQTVPIGESPADWFTRTHTWGDVLGRHGWTIAAGDGESDGSSWRHPTATATSSATISHNGLLFVYSTNTMFEPTAPGDAHGYTKFRAFAVLEHHGDLSAAARAARILRGER